MRVRTEIWRWDGHDVFSSENGDTWESCLTLEAWENRVGYSGPKLLSLQDKDLCI
jgi:hypothetical protein